MYCLQVIAENLSEEEIAGLREMFKMIDTDNSGQITFDELNDGLRRFGANLTESETYQLMQAVSIWDRSRFMCGILSIKPECFSDKCFNLNSL